MDNSECSCLEALHQPPAGIRELVDSTWLTELLISFADLSGLHATIVALPEYEIIAQSSVLPLCQSLLRTKPGADVACSQCRADISRHIQQEETARHIAPCAHGLMDGATSIVVNGEHLATIHVGPFIYPDTPEEDIVALTNSAAAKATDPAMAANGTAAVPEAQAGDVTDSVPVVSRERVEAALRLLSSVAQMITEKALDNITIAHCSKQHEIAAANRKQAQDKLSESLRQLEVIFANSQVGILHLNGGRFLERANQRLADILGYDSPQEMQGLDMRKLHLSEQHYQDFGRQFHETLVSGEQLQVEYELCRKDGSAVWCSLSGKALDGVTPPDLDKGVLWVLDDISSRKELEGRLRTMAAEDVLTGASNRRAFRELAGRELALHQRDKRSLTLLMLDIDYFKAINDSWGHLVGDEVLCTFVHMVRGLLRESDILGRLGGEEFAIAMPSTDLDGAFIVADRICKAIANTPILLKGGKSLNVTVSIGIATSPPDSELNALIEHADAALYRAKRAGRNQVAAFYE